MTLSSVYSRRFSCRAFGQEPIPGETLTELLEAARWAPNAGNLQPTRFAAVLEQQRRAALATAAYNQSFIAQAPVVICICVLPEESGRFYGRRGRELYCLQDAAAAAQNMLLAATELGLGSCWVGAFDEDAAARILELPATWRPVALIALGHPAEEPGVRTRHTLDELVVWR